MLAITGNLDRCWSFFRARSAFAENNRGLLRIGSSDAAIAAVRRESGLTIVGKDKLDSAVVAALYVEHAEQLRAFLLGLLGSNDLAGEALQATFVKTMESGHTSREETRKGWLFRVAFNEAMVTRRRRKLHERSLRRLAWGPSGAGGSGERPEENVVRWETVETVRKALETLPAEQLRVVQMRVYEEKTFAVIAEELSLPLSTVLTRMRLALRKLADRLNAEDEP